MTQPTKTTLTKGPMVRLLRILLFYVALAASCYLFVEDWGTGLLGYAMTPSAKLFTETTFAVAVLLQIVSMIVALTWGARPQNKLSFREKLRAYAMNPRTYILIFCLTLDAIYDAYFRTSPAKTQAEFAWTLFESLALYTVGSEILLSYAFVQFTERGAKGLADAGFVPWASTFACRLWTELCAAGRFGRQLLHNPQAVEDQLRRRANGHGQERGAPRERREYAQAADSYESEEEQRSYRGPGLFEQSEGV